MMKEKVEKKSILHICNGWSGSKVHYNLCCWLGILGVSNNFVISPIRKGASRNAMSLPDRTSVNYFDYNNKIIKYIPLIKVLWIYLKVRRTAVKWLNTHSTTNEKTVCLAHTFWSDGLIAYLLHLQTKVNYILVVRNTDMNVFLKYLPHYRWLFRQMISRSRALVFVSEAHRDRFKNSWPKLYSASSQVLTIPNGVDQYWIDNKVNIRVQRQKRICFVGQFIDIKNIGRLIDAVKLARKKIPELECWLIGGEVDDIYRLTGLNSIPDYIVVVQRVESREKLRDMYKACRVMAMPSLRETFGLVYVEALSQGCSIICSQGEGFDGAVNGDFVRTVNPRSVKEISNAIVELVEKYPDGIRLDDVEKIAASYSWSRVANEYLCVVNMNN